MRDEQVAPNVTQYTRCRLSAGTAHVISVRSVSNGVPGDPVTAIFNTEQGDPQPPPVPELVNVSTTTATIRLKPVVLTEGPLTAYQIEVDRILVQEYGGALTSHRRRKRHPDVPGYVTAELSPIYVTVNKNFVIGDGQTYGGFRNEPLLPGQSYNVYFVVLSTLDGLTKYNYSKMANVMNTSVLTTTQNPTTTATTEETSTLPAKSDIRGVLIGVVVGLAFLIFLILLIILIVWWCRRRSRLMKPTRFVGLFEEDKYTLDPETFWSQITSLTEHRYIVAGRECLPDSSTYPSEAEIATPNTPKVTFRQEFQSLPHKYPQATTREAEKHRELNRFPHILPFDHSRVQIPPDKYSTSTYINANYISGYRAQRMYIAAQSPFDDKTVVDFWRMIHHLSIKTVVMVTNAVDDNIIKCAQYWPESGKVSIYIFKFGNIIYSFYNRGSSSSSSSSSCSSIFIFGKANRCK